MITGITVISPSVESRANRMAPHFHPDLCRRRVHSALCCGCVSRDEPAAAALDVFALAHTAVIHSDWLTDFFCSNHQAPTTPPVAPPKPPPPRAAPVRNPIFPKQPLHLKVTWGLSEAVACAAQPVIDPIIVPLGVGASTGSRWGQVTSRITSELRGGFQLSGTLWRSDLEATFMCFFGDKEGRAGCGVNRIVLGIELKFHPFSQRAATLSLHLASVQRPLGSFLFVFFQKSDKWLQI